MKLILCLLVVVSALITPHAALLRGTREDLRDQNRRHLTDEKVDKTAGKKGSSSDHGGDKKVEHSSDQNPKQDDSKTHAKNEAENAKSGDASKQNAGDASQAEAGTQNTREDVKNDADTQGVVGKKKTTSASHQNERHHGKVGTKHTSDADTQRKTDEGKQDDTNNQENNAGKQNAGAHRGNGQRKKAGNRSQQKRSNKNLNSQNQDSKPTTNRLKIIADQENKKEDESVFGEILGNAVKSEFKPASDLHIHCEIKGKKLTICEFAASETQTDTNLSNIKKTFDAAIKAKNIKVATEWSKARSGGHGKRGSGNNKKGTNKKSESSSTTTALAAVIVFLLLGIAIVFVYRHLCKKKLEAVVSETPKAKESKKKPKTKRHDKKQFQKIEDTFATSSSEEVDVGENNADDKTDGLEESKQTKE